MRVADIMSTSVVTCGSSDSLSTAAQMMWQHDCGTIPVVDADNRLVGIVTDRDICMAAYTQGRRLPDIPVSTAMATEVFTCAPDDPIDSAARLMRDHRVRRLPVVDADHRPIGLLSLNDIARRATDPRKGNGLQRDLVETLSVICSPRPEA